MTGIIIKALSGFYYISHEDKVYTCKARGSFRKSGISPLVGDKVEFSLSDDGNGMVDSILERKNCLERPPVANIEKLFIVSSYETPAPNTLVIDKMTVIALHNGIEPIIVFNKCDMGDFKEWVEIYKKAGFKTYVVSASSGEGMDKLETELEGCTSAFTGNSGVGKSSILNYWLGEGRISTGEISEKLGRGRHTTRHTELYPLPFGGFVADTPGFSTLELIDFDLNDKDELKFCFPEFSEYFGNCTFSSCTHVNEPGCAVLDAVRNGEVAQSRIESYASMYEDLKKIKPWEKTRK